MTKPPAFFVRAGPFTLDGLARIAGARLTSGSDATRRICGVAPLEHAGREEVSFFAHPRYARALSATRAGACILQEAHAPLAPETTDRLLCDNPHVAYALVAAAFHPDAMEARDDFGEAGIHKDASVHGAAEIEPGVRIAPGAVIGAGAQIGRGTAIGAGAVIGRDVAVGRDCAVGAQATLICALVGDRVILHAGVRIGQDGFGFAPTAEGHVKVPQTGRVIIQDNVEIGANSTIDRGSNADTVIGEGTKIDNLVHIAHNVHIGRHCLIAGQVGIAGSVRIGDGVAIGGQTAVTDQVTVGAGAQIAGKSGVSNNVPAGEVYGGYPAQPVRLWRKEVAILRHLRHRRKRKEGI